MIVLQTERLIIRQLATTDAEFILTLLNEPSFLHHIGDKNVRTLDDARNYISTGPIASYERHGFGQFLVELKESRTPIGISGLMKRDELPDVDIGFALLPQFWGKGYAFEAATALMKYGCNELKLKRIVAIVNPDNDASIKLLERLGMKFERMVKLSEAAQEVKFFVQG